MINKSHLGIYGIVERGDHILLIKKTRGPYKGMWDLPGGSPSHGETIFQTLLREVEEETGIVVIEAIPSGNYAFLVEYAEGDDLIALHHTCLIYKVTQFDASHYNDSIVDQDAGGCVWMAKSELKRLSLSKVVEHAIT